MYITLIGSARFREDFNNWNSSLTMRGHVVYSLGELRDIEREIGDIQKKVADAVHLTKIQNSEGVLLINRKDYIGESTMGELLFAILNNKSIFCTDEPKVRKWGIGTRYIQPARCLLDENSSWDNWKICADTITWEGNELTIADMDRAPSDRLSFYLPQGPDLAVPTYPPDGPQPQQEKSPFVSKY